MSKTILLGTGGTYSFDVKAQKWNYIMLGTLFLIQGFGYLYSVNLGFWAKAMMMSTFLSGFYAIVFAIINFTKTSKLSPKVIVDEDKIEFKTSLFKKGKTFSWKMINSLQFKPFRIDIKTDDTVEVLAYDCTSDISIDIKEAIREVAEMKGIEVTGG